MAHVTPIGAANEAQVSYRLEGHGCPDQRFDYRTAEERPLRWIGEGVREVGLTPGAAFVEGDKDRARALMQGVDPATGEQLVERKLAVFEDAKVPLAPLVAAIRQGIQTGRIDPDGWAGRMRKAWESAERAVGKQGERVTRRADEAGELADRAGLAVEAVWGEEEYERAYRNLFEDSGNQGGDEAGEPVLQPRRRVVGNAGYDVTFTLPKSMSLLLAFAPDDAVEGIEEIYSTQVGRTFDWLEAETAYGMRGKHGGGKSAAVTQGSGFLGWAMVHRAARPVGDAEVGDPHWHVHVTVANMTRSVDDGRWSAVAGGGRDLMRHAPAVGKVLRSLTRHQLSVEHGVVFARSARTEAWEVVGVPDATIRHFSRRGGSIHELMEQLGLSEAAIGPEAERIVEATTRGAKTEHTTAADVVLRDWWVSDARDAGIDAAAEVAAALHRRRERTETEAREDLIRRLAVELSDPDEGLTAHRRRFSRLDAIGAVADALPGGVGSLGELEELTAEVLEQPQFRGVDELTTRAREGLDHGHLANAKLFTTHDVVAAEQAIFARAVTQPGGELAVVEPEAAAAAIGVTEAGQGYELSSEQRRAVAAMVTSGRTVDTVLGPPGTGKTTIMRAARAAWEAGGHRVAGVATAAVAAQHMQTESGIPSRTVAAVLHAPHRYLSEVDVLVVDEANLTDDRARAALYEVAAAHAVKVVEIGDPRQLRGVGCGSAFGALHQVTAGAELSQNRRQLEVEERLALQAWRAGEYAQAWESWADRGRVRAVETAAEATRDMVLDGIRLRRGAGDVHDAIGGVVMLAGTNGQVRELNQLTHAVRAAEGEVTAVTGYALANGEQLRVGVGDQVLIRINSRSQRLHEGDDVLNGYRGVVTRTGPDGVGVEWRHDGPDGPETRTAVLPADYIARGGLELGYAMTTHKAEGLTVAGDWTTPDGEHVEGVVLASLHGMDNPAAYVAASRHKGRFIAYAAREVVETREAAERYAEPPETAVDRARRVLDGLVSQARLGETNRNDDPVVPAPARQDPTRTAQERLAEASARLAQAQAEAEPSHGIELEHEPVDHGRDRGIER
ncbi:MobF family relaxase [Microlunatus sp. Y2014]|uniref:MobF family relaxase n=1 Tax=Microlunatus sp. Y2014 TaxID=3418488 RepID=UPI003DA7775E